MFYLCPHVDSWESDVTCTRTRLLQRKNFPSRKQTTLSPSSQPTSLTFHAYETYNSPCPHRNWFHPQPHPVLSGRSSPRYTTGCYTRSGEQKFIFHYHIMNITLCFSCMRPFPWGYLRGLCKQSCSKNTPDFPLKCSVHLPRAALDLELNHFTLGWYPSFDSI